MRRLFEIAAFMLAAALIASCTAQREAERESVIPDDVEYSIIDSNIIPGIKRGLEVRLNRKVSEDTLEAIALEIKNQDNRDYERTLIAYFLPDMTPGTGAWAVTNFDPDLELQILGLTSEQEETLSKAEEPEGREIVGRWLDDRPFAGNRITIYRENGILYGEQVFEDGSGSTIELIETDMANGRHFDDASGPNDFGDHWVLDSSGNLQLRDNEGLIGTAKTIP